MFESSNSKTSIVGIHTIFKDNLGKYNQTKKSSKQKYCIEYNITLMNISDRNKRIQS